MKSVIIAFKFLLLGYYYNPIMLVKAILVDEIIGDAGSYPFDTKPTINLTRIEYDTVSYHGIMQLCKIDSISTDRQGIEWVEVDTFMVATPKNFFNKWGIKMAKSHFCIRLSATNYLKWNGVLYTKNDWYIQRKKIYI